MEHREIFTPASVTVAGVTIEVDVSLSIEVWQLGAASGGSRAGNALAGRVHAEPKTIRIATGDDTFTTAL